MFYILFMEHNNILATVLAGGKSQRFGEDKSQILLADKILIDSEEWSIVDTPHPNYTGNALTVVYKIQVRK